VQKIIVPYYRERSFCQAEKRSHSGLTLLWL